MKVFVDKWPDFRVVVCKPQWEQKGDSFKDIGVFANDDDAVLEAIIRKPSVFDWTTYSCVGTNLENRKIFKAVATEKHISSRDLALCYRMTLNDVSSLPSTDSAGMSLGSLNESHIGMINQTWKFGQRDEAVRMIQNMVKNFPSCCLLDADRKPVSWILTYASCAMGMLYTLPEHRGKGYAKVVVSAMAKRFHAEGYPVFCFVEEDNTVSYNLFKGLRFTEDPSYREAWFDFNCDQQNVK